MSFSGDLEHLPIVDVIQLLHSTRKSGTLHVSSQKGESQLVFRDGYIVSANHADNHIRIGQILLDMNIVSQEQLQQALQVQSQAGSNRRPLIATLLESRQIEKDDAYKGLENLIEMSIVDILSWKSGFFRLAIDDNIISDEYRYFPETLKQDIMMNTQGILMDALRIYDEKKRNGTLDEGPFKSSLTPMPDSEPAEPVTPDLLGLDELEALEKKIPDVYMGLRDSSNKDSSPPLPASADPAAKETGSVATVLQGQDMRGEAAAVTPNPQRPQAAIIFSQDDYIIRMITSVCKYNGLPVFSTDNTLMLAELLDRTELEAHGKLIIFDAPQPADCLLNEENIISVIESYCKGSQIISAIQLIGGNDHGFSSRALLAGAQSILPRPQQEKGSVVFGKETTDFLKLFQQYLERLLLSGIR